MYNTSIGPWMAFARTHVHKRKSTVRGCHKREKLEARLLLYRGCLKSIYVLRSRCVVPGIYSSKAKKQNVYKKGIESAPGTVGRIPVSPCWECEAFGRRPETRVSCGQRYDAVAEVSIDPGRSKATSEAESKAQGTSARVRRGCREQRSVNIEIIMMWARPRV